MTGAFMGGGDTPQISRTRIILGDDSLRVLLIQHTDGSQASEASARQDLPKTCEFREYLQEKAKNGAWILRASRRFCSEPNPEVKHSETESPTSERELLQEAKFMLRVAHNVSTWSLYYLRMALRENGRPPHSISTSVGEATVTPQCTADQSLAELTIYYPTKDLQLNYTSREELKIYDTTFCTKSAPATDTVKKQ